MSQEKAWEREYRESKLVTKDSKPQADTVRFVRFLKDVGVSLDNARVLDLGCGTGRNALYCAEKGAHVSGLDISKTAVGIAQERIQEAGFTQQVNIIYGSIGEILPYTGSMFDIALDVTSSNSLSESERSVFMSEVTRVLKAGGYFFTKALCKDGDANAHTLLKHSPGKEKDTYYMKELDLYERVWSRQDFIDTYSPYFDIVEMEKKTTYTRMNNRVYKRNFWIVYMQKKHT